MEINNYDDHGAGNSAGEINRLNEELTQKVHWFVTQRGQDIKEIGELAAENAELKRHLAEKEAETLKKVGKWLRRRDQKFGYDWLRVILSTDIDTFDSGRMPE